MPYFDRFDIFEAYYLYYSENHGGQWSREYAILSRVSRWGRVSPLLCSFDDLTENGKEIYLLIDERETQNTKQETQ